MMSESNNMARSLAFIFWLYILIFVPSGNLAYAQSLGQLIDNESKQSEIHAGDWQGDDHAAARLLSLDKDAASQFSKHAINVVNIDENQHWFGVEFRLAKGWHIYGRDPGEAGLPPVIQFVDAAVKLPYPPEATMAASELKKLGFSARILWPQDKMLQILGIISRGYDQPVILPILLSERSSNTPHKTLKNQPEIKEVTRFQKQRLYAADVTFAACAEICVPYHVVLRLERNDKATRLVGTELNIVALLWATSLNSVSAAEIDAARKNQAYNYPQIEAVQAASLPKNAPMAPAHDLGLIIAIGLAFLGGVILNFMPCVLPVISLKLLGFARISEADVPIAKNMQQTQTARPLLSIARLEMGAIFVGIVLSFFLLGLVLAGLKLSGVAVGWGMQFQQPLFLGVMTLVLLVFSANLWGLFAIPLPFGINRIFNWGGFGIGAGYGQKIEQRRRKIWLKALGTGLLSTLLATPCSAPLVGTALTYALSRQTSEILVIFTAMGVGFAAFYGLAFMLPGVGRFMPKPGAWTLHLRKILGVIMLLSAVWMGYLWLSSLTPLQSNQISDKDPAQVSTTDLNWQEFTPQKLAQFQAEQRIILVNVTARWCLTCKANEVLVLNTDKTYELLTKAHVVLLRADWTHPNPMIAEYLAQNNRYGIPFNAIYRPNSGSVNGMDQHEPILLPEILTFDAVQQAVTAAQ